MDGDSSSSPELKVRYAFLAWAKHLEGPSHLRKVTLSSVYPSML